jgi:hypothetical protein
MSNTLAPLTNSTGIELLYPANAGDDTVSQYDRVYDTFRDNRHTWMTLAQISEITGIRSESSIASRIRDMRDLDNCNVERRLQIGSVGRSRVYEYAWTY